MTNLKVQLFPPQLLLLLLLSQLFPPLLRIDGLELLYGSPLGLFQLLLTLLTSPHPLHHLLTYTTEEQVPY